MANKEKKKVIYDKVDPNLISVEKEGKAISENKYIHIVNYDGCPLIFTHKMTDINCPFGIKTDEYKNDSISFIPDKYLREMFKDVANGIESSLEKVLGPDVDSEIITSLSPVRVKIKKGISKIFDIENNAKRIKGPGLDIYKDVDIRLYGSISVPTILIDNSSDITKVYIQFVLDQAEVEIEKFSLTR